MDSEKVPECCVIYDSTGELIYSTTLSQCDRCVSDTSIESEITKNCCISKERRRGNVFSKSGQVFLCSERRDDVESSKTFKKKIVFLSDMVLYLSEMRRTIADSEAKKTNRLFHNLTSINAHTIQELYALVPQDSLSSKFRDQREIVKERLLRDPRASADAFLKVLKNEISLRNEFSVYSKLYEAKPTLRIAIHSLHKVILNVVNLFFQEFADRFIKVTIEPTSVRLKLDYESIQVALYHLFDNAAKYAMRDSEITVKFTEGDFGVRMDIVMRSLYISPHETTRLFDEGFSGEQPGIAGNAGKGLGMWMIRELLRLNGAVITVKPGRDEMRSVGIGQRSLSYATNVFSIIFDACLIVSDTKSLAKELTSTRLTPQRRL